MLGFQMTASGHVPYPSKSSNLCRASRTISSVTSGLRMSLICSGEKSNMSTRNQLQLLHSVGRQRSLTLGSDLQGSLEVVKKDLRQRVQGKINFACWEFLQRPEEIKEEDTNPPLLPWRTHTVFRKGREDLNTVVVQSNSLGMKAEDNSDLIYLREEKCPWLCWQESQRKAVQQEVKWRQLSSSAGCGYRHEWDCSLYNTWHLLFHCFIKCTVPSHSAKFNTVFTGIKGPIILVRDTQHLSKKGLISL